MLLAVALGVVVVAAPPMDVVETIENKMHMLAIMSSTWHETRPPLP